MTKRFSMLTAACCVLAIAACASQKAPADAALKAAQQAYDAVKADAAKYVPQEATDVESAIAAAKASFDKGDYAAALTAAQALPARISALGSAVAAKKTELTTAWTALSAGLPQVVAAIQGRVDILSKSKKLPASIDAAAFDGVKTGLAGLNQTLVDATTAANGGDLATAVAKANDVKAQAVKALGVLGLPVPAGLQ
jgi:hypothetical protein